MIGRPVERPAAVPLNTMRQRFASRWHGHQQLRFVVIGGWNTVVGYLAFVVLYALLHEHVHYLVIGVIAHVIAMVNAFLAHRLVVFKSSLPWVAEFIRFNLAQLTVLGGGLLALWILVRAAGLDPLVAQAIVTIGAVAASYGLHRWFTFAER